MGMSDFNDQLRKLQDTKETLESAKFEKKSGEVTKKSKKSLSWRNLPIKKEDDSHDLSIESSTEIKSNHLYPPI